MNRSFSDEELVVAYLRNYASKDDALFWAWQRMQEYVSTDPTKAWQLTLQLIAAAPDNGVLGFVAAGPLEDLLHAQGPVFIDELERLAASDPKFQSALRLIAGPFTQEFDVSNRIVKAAGVPLPCVDDDWPSCMPPEEAEMEDGLSSDQEARAALLTLQELDRIDNSLLSHVRQEWRKLATIVGLAMAECDGEIRNVSDAFYSRRVGRLVAQGRLLAFGDLKRMQRCEIRLPFTGHSRPTG